MRIEQLASYRDVFVLDEEAVEEPDDGAEGEREGEGEGHVLHAPRLNHTLLHEHKRMRNGHEHELASRVSKV